MTTISPELDDAIAAFTAKNQGKVTPEMAANLRACIESSPELLEQMNRAVAKRHLVKTIKIARQIIDDSLRVPAILPLIRFDAVLGRL